MSNKNERIRSWLDSVDPNDYVVSDEDEPCPSVVESSIIETSSSSESGDELPLGVTTNNIETSNFNNIIPQIPALTFNNVNISNSSNVYLGNIYSVNGNLNINVINKDDETQEEEENGANITAKKCKLLNKFLIWCFSRCTLITFSSRGKTCLSYISTLSLASNGPFN